jgi:hypothetical protein
MQIRGIPLSEREKIMTNSGNRNPNEDQNIGWYSGISKHYIVSGKLLDLANEHNYDLVAGLSGTFLRNLVIFCCLGLDMNESFLANLINISGSFHHSVFECVLAGLHFNKFLIENNLKDKFCEFNICHDYLNYISYIKNTIYQKLNDKTRKDIEEIIKEYKFN